MKMSGLTREEAKAMFRKSKFVQDLVKAIKNEEQKKAEITNYNFPKFERSELIDASQTQIFK